MKKTRRRYDRDFKIFVVSELESDGPLAIDRPRAWSPPRPILLVER